MKKIIATITFVMALMAGLQSQAQINVHAGFLSHNTVTTTKVLNSTVNDTAKLPGGYIGADLNINLVGNLGVSLGANVEYLQKTSTGNVGSIAGVESTDKKINIAVPVTLNYAFSLGGKAKFNLFAGPEAYFGLVNKTDYHATVLGVSKDWSTNWFENNDANTEDYYTERFSWGVTCGFGINFDQVGLHVGFTKMMSDVYKSDNVTSSAFRLNVGLNFNF